MKGDHNHKLRTSGLDPKVYPTMWIKVKCDHRVSPEGRRVSKLVAPPPRRVGKTQMPSAAASFAFPPP